MRGELKNDEDDENHENHFRRPKPTSQSKEHSCLPLLVLLTRSSGNSIPLRLGFYFCCLVAAFCDYFLCNEQVDAKFVAVKFLFVVCR